MNEIILDIETQNTFQETGRRDCKLLKVSLLVTYHYKTDEFKVYFERDLPKLWNELLSAERVIGYNLNGFDYPVLNNYAPYDLFKLPTLDMMDEVQKTLGFRIKLDSIAQGSLGIGKSGNGLDAVRFWKEGNMEELKKYCTQDVLVTKRIYEYGKQNGFVRFDDHLTGEKREVKINFIFQEKEKSIGNLTLEL